MQILAASGADPTPDLVRNYMQVRQQSLQLVEGLGAEDCALQSMPDASPAKWHLAHTSWFFETFVLERFSGKYRAFRPEYRYLYNSYYNGIGAQYPRPQRGMLSRPPLDEVLRYRRHVDGAVEALLGHPRRPEEARSLVELGLHHEQQHQELLLTDIKHLFSLNPLAPAYRTGSLSAADSAFPALRWRRHEGGIARIGHGGNGFAFDNEMPQHRHFLHAYELADRPVANAEFLAFIEDGGYRRPELWLSDGWVIAQAQQWEAPLYWRRIEDSWHEFTLRGLQPLNPAQPVVHVSHFEADAYARWAAREHGATRLPTEFEWEAAALRVPVQGNFLETGRLHPAAGPVGALFGDAWEWTQSAYAPYPGYHPATGAVGEYNGKFMSNQYVLRGGSCASARSHIRATYRNFFPSTARWQFSGIRLARDPGFCRMEPRQNPDVS